MGLTPIANRLQWSSDFTAMCSPQHYKAGISERRTISQRNCTWSFVHEFYRVLLQGLLFHSISLSPFSGADSGRRYCCSLGEHICRQCSNILLPSSARPLLQMAVCCTCCSYLFLLPACGVTKLPKSFSYTARAGISLLGVLASQ